MRNVARITTHILVATLLVASPLFSFQPVSADPLPSRSITISNSAPSAVNRHLFKFDIQTVSNIGSIEFEYCTNSPFIGTFCNPPLGLDIASASLSAQTGEIGFSIDGSTTANRMVLTRPVGLTSAIPVSYTFDNVTNQSAPANTVYVRISTYASTDATGPRTDSGAVAYATVSGVTVNGYVPPYLTFCVGVVVALNCTNASGTSLDFGEFSTNQPKFLTSQFSVATNDPGGYAATLFGTTMTSGNNVIPALASPQSSQPGTSQFGMNLRGNSNPPVGADPSGIGVSTIAPTFAIPNQYVFNNQVITSSPLPTNFNLFTASYIVNISDSQNPGIYSTTLTYIATAAF